jgi:hypothetical protein
MGPGQPSLASVQLERRGNLGVDSLEGTQIADRSTRFETEQCDLVPKGLCGKGDRGSRDEEAPGLRPR